jgi:GNAT superfamily N-acetyltransferase
LNVTLRELQIIRAQPHQAPLLTRIAVKSKRHWGYPEAWMKEWTELLTISPSVIARDHVYCAELDGRAAGFYVLRAREDRGELEHLWVLPECMGQGIGRALFEHTVAQGRASLLNRLFIESDPNAAGFYARMGARRIDMLVSELGGVPREVPVFAYELALIQTTQNRHEVDRGDVLIGSLTS